MAEVRVYGVRHHGPGSALSLKAVLDAFRPDCVLIEGPPDADALIPLAAAAGAEPPLALLVYRADRPRQCAFFPFARFSPEWVAIRHALAGGVPVRFMDLPQAVQFADEDQDEDGRAAEEAAAAGTPEAGGAVPVPEVPDDGQADDAGALPAPSAAAVRRDPLGELARAAGYDDGERWWDAFVESRTRSGEDAFAAVSEAMAALREAAREVERPSDAAETLREERREAHMRTAIRAAAKGGSTRVAAVCGAWHAPALLRHGARGQAGADAAVLRGLPRVKVAAAWAPWSYERLAAASGYRAGVLSPEWYDLLWSHGEGAEGSGRAAHGVAARWLARAAALLRTEDLDASPASVIEAVRLAEALANFRGRARPALEDVDEAAGATLCFADPAPLALIRRKLVIGERLGVAPPGGPRTPLEADFAAQCRTLRLAPEAAARELELDLRRETDLARSRFLNRLDLLGVPWGKRRGTLGRGRGRGTFRELWALRWAPEWAVDLVAASAEGATVAEAAAARVAAAARRAARVADLAALIGRLLEADLPDASAAVVRAISDRAALSGDVFDLMAALPPLAELARYGSVRSSDTEAVAAILRGIVPRVAAGLVPACQSLDDAAAAAARARIEAAEAAVALTGEAELTSTWRDALRALADQDHVHGLVVGRAARILFDAGAMDGGEAGGRLALALSRAVGAAPAAAWISGFLDGGGTALIHGAGLLAVVDGWLCGLDAALFDELLPLVRRTFSTMQKPERRAIGEALRRTGGPIGSGAPDRPDDGRTFDIGRAALVLPMLRLLFGPVEGPP